MSAIQYNNEEKALLEKLVAMYTDELVLKCSKLKGLIGKESNENIRHKDALFAQAVIYASMNLIGTTGAATFDEATLKQLFDDLPDIFKAHLEQLYKLHLDHIKSLDTSFKA